MGDAREDGYLRVSDLRAVLEGMPGDFLVVLSEDSEGNGFSPLAEVEEAWYDEEEDEAGSGSVARVEDPEADPGRGERCVVLWPIA